MISSKEEFLRSFLPKTVRNIEYTQINIDTSDLSISDVLRNLNKIYPRNSKNRNEIESGSLVVGVLCRTETLYPYKGLFLLLTSDTITTNIASSDYIVMCISESRIISEDNINMLIDDITKHLIENYHEVLRDFSDFYRKYVYNESELYDEDDDLPTNYQFIEY